MTAMALKDKLTEGEMEVVMSVFRQYETGLREACIDVKVIVSCGRRIENFPLNGAGDSFQ